MDEQYLKDARVARIARICCNISLFCGIVLLIFGLMPILKVLYYFIIFIFSAAVIVAWLMSLLLFHPFDISFLQPLYDSTGEAFAIIQLYSFKCAPYVCAVALALGIAGVVLILRDKSVRKTGKIVAASLGLAFAVIGTVAIIVGVMR